MQIFCCQIWKPLRPERSMISMMAPRNAAVSIIFVRSWSASTKRCFRQGRHCRGGEDLLRPHCPTHWPWRGSPPAVASPCHGDVALAPHDPLAPIWPCVSAKGASTVWLSRTPPLGPASRLAAPYWGQVVEGPEEQTLDKAAVCSSGGVCAVPGEMEIDLPGGQIFVHNPSGSELSISAFGPDPGIQR